MNVVRVVADIVRIRFDLVGPLNDTGGGRVACWGIDPHEHLDSVTRLLRHQTFRIFSCRGLMKESNLGAWAPLAFKMSRHTYMCFAKPRPSDHLTAIIIDV